MTLKRKTGCLDLITQLNTGAKLSTLLLLLFFTSLINAQPFPQAVEKWTTPQRLFDGSFPTVTWDGKRIYYLHIGGINYRTLTDTGWSLPVVLGHQVSYPDNIRKIVLSTDEKSIFFSGSVYIYRSKWVDSLNDWGRSEIMTENGFNFGIAWWEVSNFLDDSTMIVLDGGQSKISYFNYSTGLWGTPIGFPSPSFPFMSDYGSWVHPNRKKVYITDMDYQKQDTDVFVYYKVDSTYSNRKTLNISLWSDSLFLIGELYKRGEYYPSLTPDGKTMYFNPSYDSLGGIYVSHMYIDENGDTVTAINTEESNNINEKDFNIYPAYPNPFNSTTTLKYHLKNRSVLKISLTDILGRKVKEIFAGEQIKGEHEVSLNMGEFSSGIYIVSFSTGSLNKSLKIIYLK